MFCKLTYFATYLFYKKYQQQIDLGINIYCISGLAINILMSRSTLKLLHLRLEVLILADRYTHSSGVQLLYRVIYLFSSVVFESWQWRSARQIDGWMAAWWIYALCISSSFFADADIQRVTQTLSQTFTGERPGAQRFPGRKTDSTLS